jgi:xanthine/uracil permease
MSSDLKEMSLISRLVDFVTYLISQPVQQVFKVFLSLVGVFTSVIGVLCVIGVFNYLWEHPYTTSMAKFSPIVVGLILVLIGFGLMIFTLSVIADYKETKKKEAQDEHTD